MNPREFPCEPIVYDPLTPEDPFWQNPLITANFYNLTSWKNKRNGAIVGTASDLRFNNFKTADNLLAGIEFELTDVSADGLCQVNDSLIIGKSANSEQTLEMASPHGIISPRTENFTIDSVRFYNFDWNSAAALGDCSHCYHGAATDSGARTVTVKNLTFDETVTKRIRYQYPFLGIYKDLTGDLTEKGPNTWAMAYLKHNEAWSECETNMDLYDGHTCDNST